MAVTRTLSSLHYLALLFLVLLLGSSLPSGNGPLRTCDGCTQCHVIIKSMHSPNFLFGRFVFRMVEASAKRKWPVMNCKGPWGRYRRQALLPAFLCAHIFIERKTSGYKAGLFGVRAFHFLIFIVGDEGRKKDSRPFLHTWILTACKTNLKNTNCLKRYYDENFCFCFRVFLT